MKFKLSNLQEYEAHAEEKAWGVALATEGRAALSSASRYVFTIVLVN